MIVKTKETIERESYPKYFQSKNGGVFFKVESQSLVYRIGVELTTIYPSNMIRDGFYVVSTKKEVDHAFKCYIKMREVEYYSKDLHPIPKEMITEDSNIGDVASKGN